MWAIINTQSKPYDWDGKSTVDMCETEEEAEAFVQWLNDHGFGGCSDWHFVKIKGRIWTELPKDLHWQTAYVKVMLKPDGSFDVSEPSYGKMNPEEENDNEWNYPEETIETMKRDGVVVNVNEPDYKHYMEAPTCSVWGYSDGSQPAHVFHAAFDSGVAEAKRRLQEKYKATVKPVETVVTEKVVWEEVKDVEEVLP